MRSADGGAARSVLPLAPYRKVPRQCVGDGTFRTYYHFTSQVSPRIVN